MNTPVADFVRTYAGADVSRLHMPGHKGKPFLGCEALDITEIAGADALYEAEGILARSEANAAALFGTARTVYSTEGSSQCIRAMLYLALTCRRPEALPVIVAARNVHRAFVYGAALLDISPQWLWPREAGRSLWECPIGPEDLEERLSAFPAPVAGVYVTSPDYLGGEQPIEALAEVCHRHGTVLLVDNAHGAYHRFLQPSRHPMDMGADLCCDSAHKTLPVLTGGAYLHISGNAPEAFSRRAKQAMAMFGSTSPSYLTLASLDLCNAYLAETYAERLSGTVERMNRLRTGLQAAGWPVCPSDPLRLTVHGAQVGLSGTELANRLRKGGVECEFADCDHLVLMATPENDARDFDRVAAALGKAPREKKDCPALPMARGAQVMTPRQALFAPQRTVPASRALGKICGAPTVACPPAIPVAVSGERFGPEALMLLAHYGIGQVEIVEE